MEKYVRRWIVWAFSFGILSSSPIVYSLPSVESRNGDPVIRYQKNSDPRYSGHHSAGNPGNRQTTQSAEFISAEDRAITSTVSQIEQLQREVAELRGMLELQENEMKLTKKSQQDLYLDLERRMNKMQAKSPANTSKKPESAASTIKKEKASVVSDENKLNTEVAALPNPPSMPAEVQVNPAPQKKENESMLYQGAYNMVKNKRYEEAVKAFKEYLEAFPQGEYAANAHYWLGEVQMVQWQGDKSNQKLLENAEKEFSTLNLSHPNHTKTADAILKMGMIELEKSNKDAAKNYFNQVKTRYPGSTAARIAETRLQELS